MAVPALPLEIIEQIFDLLEKHEDPGPQQGHDNEEEALPKLSKTLLACHMVSKQFRACALRQICRNIFVALDDTSKRLQRLQNLIVEEDPGLGSLAPFVKEVVILVMPLEDTSSEDSDTSEQLELDEDALLPVLEAFTNLITIQKLSILGRINVLIDWTSLSSSIQTALKSLLSLPSILSLRLRYIMDLPAPLLASNQHLKSLTIDHWGHLKDTSYVRASLPKLEHLSAKYLCVFPEGLSLPSLRTVNIRNADTEESETCWMVISRASRTLTNVAVYDDEGDSVQIFPKNIRIDSFPQLESFLYYNDANHLGRMSPTLRDALYFFNASRLVSNLRVITFFHCLAGDPFEYQESMAANGRAWTELDHALTAGHFAGLQKMCMNVELLSIGPESDGGAHSRVRDDVVQTNFLDLFRELRKLFISVEVNVTVSGQ